MKPTIVAIALPLEDQQLVPLHHWAAKFDWSHVSTVHFVHVTKQVITAMEYGFIEAPDDENYQHMKPELEKFVQNEARKILPQDFSGDVHFHLSKSFSPEEAMSDFLKEIHADVVVVGTRGKTGIDGLFHHSFAQHMVKHAPCDVFVVRPEA